MSSTKFVFSGWSEKQDSRPGFWLAETFRLLLWNHDTEFNGTWQEARSKRPLPSFCFGLIRKTRWPPCPLIGWYIFYISSRTGERNSMTLDWKQDLNVLFQVRFFLVDQKNKMPVLASDWLRHFQLLFWNSWSDINETWQVAKSHRPLPSLCFSGRSENNLTPWSLIGWGIFHFSSKTT